MGGLKLASVQPHESGTFMLKRAYQWMLDAASSPRAVWFLAFISFIESSVFPIAPDVMLIPMVIARPSKALFYAAVTTGASVLGGCAGYGIGYFLFTQVGQPLLNFYGYLAQFDQFAANFNAHGVWIVLAGGLTPLPYKIITITSGVTHMNFAEFLAASVASRAMRFFAEAMLVARFGPSIQRTITRYGGLVSIGLFLLLVGGFVLLKYVL